MQVLLEQEVKKEDGLDDVERAMELNRQRRKRLGHVLFLSLHGQFLLRSKNQQLLSSSPSVGGV